ncbi:MAG TPA: hypothetical protein VKZ18_16455 [Polyangia bacterium]|nr:hypothetical protein [Polyangia bacterium]
MQAGRGRRIALLGLISTTLVSLGCNDGGGAPPPTGAGGAGGSPVTVTTVSIPTATRTPRTGTWSVNYWTWTPTFGNSVSGTEALVAALTPSYLRVGGYNNDANTPDSFDDAQLDAMVAYARAIGAEPILQVPHLAADNTGTPATPDTAAAMVQYANVTKGYGIKYFSVGNEPDLYDTQGLPSDSSMPAIPGYTPAEYCASVTSFVAAMKAVDPTIKIVGPDLAYKYQAGAGVNLDWLTPILQTCGDLFDVVSIHRYPFEAAMASLPAAAGDPVQFRQVMTSVRGILQQTGQGDKPLALTEMNIAYDATGCVLGASPGTVGSALWMADILGSSIALDLWTSAVWDISDTDSWSLGIIGLPPGHVPRPEYYAFLLYAEHVGPTVLGAPTGLPAGVSAYASRNAADNATEIILVNWNTAPVALQLQVADLNVPPTAPTYLLPATSLAAVEITDTSKSTAWVYGEDERRAAAGPQPISPGTAPAPGIDAGTAVPAGRTVGDECTSPDAGISCTLVKATSPVITAAGTMSATGVAFGSGDDAWGSYSYAAAGQTAPTGAATSDGNGLQITGGFVAPVAASGNYMGFGLYYSSGSCLDASAYTGVQFDFSGTLGGCDVQVAVSFSADDSHSGDKRGACTAAQCYGPSYDVTGAANTATASAPTIKVPFAQLGGGMPISTLDPRDIVTVQWQLTSPAGGTDGGACSANFTVANVKFY